MSIRKPSRSLVRFYTHTHTNRHLSLSLSIGLNCAIQLSHTEENACENRIFNVANSTLCISYQTQCHQFHTAKNLPHNMQIPKFPIKFAAIIQFCRGFFSLCSYLTEWSNELLIKWYVKAILYESLQAAHFYRMKFPFTNYAHHSSGMLGKSPNGKCLIKSLHLFWVNKV